MRRLLILSVILALGGIEQVHARLFWQTYGSVTDHPSGLPIHGDELLAGIGVNLGEPLTPPATTQPSEQDSGTQLPLTGLPK